MHGGLAAGGRERQAAHGKGLLNAQRETNYTIGVSAGYPAAATIIEPCREARQSVVAPVDNVIRISQLVRIINKCA